jgi:hypothetical protein
MSLNLRIAAFWIGVVVATGGWFAFLDWIGLWPLMVKLSLAAMAPMAGLWWHMVLFQDKLKAIRLARLAAAKATPAAATPAPAPVAAAPATEAEARLAAALRQRRDAAASLAWDAGMQRDLRQRLATDTGFAAAAAALPEAERGVLLLASREALVAASLDRAAAILLRERIALPSKADPLARRLQASLAQVSTALAAEFDLALEAAPGLDPVDLSRRLVARHMAAVEAREAAATQAALTLLNQAAAILQQEKRPAVRAAVVAHLAGQAERPGAEHGMALLEAYCATAQAPEAAALAALARPVRVAAPPPLAAAARAATAPAWRRLVGLASGPLARPA